VTGIGFLGAGAIIRQGLSVRGLTTAATLWLVAAIGMASGAGYWEAAIIATVGALVTLWPLRIAAHRVIARIRPEDEQRLVVELAGQQGAAPVLASLEGLGGTVSQFQLSESRGGRELVVTVDFREQVEASKVASRLAELEHVTGVHWAD
jgi:putative Mg2+ transporter-C (MgtC) family protein